MANSLSPQSIALVKVTVPALEAHGATITATMYRRLFQNPEAAALFNQANQKGGTQVQALAGAILAYARNIENLGALGGAVERIAQKHIGYAIHPEHYPYVATALLGAIKEVLGEAATPAILEAWGEAYWFLADILKGREAEIREEITAQEGGWADWRRFMISERRRESEIITSFVLRPEDGGKVVPHKPGQYLTFRFDLAGLPGVKRNYSISSGPNDSYYRITVKREPEGEASPFLHDRAVVGTVIECTPPAGNFHLPELPARAVILLSGGVGLTPMVSMLETIAARHPDLPTWYVHGTASRATHALDADVRSLAARHGKTTVATFYDHSDDEAQAHSGFITIDWLATNTPLQEADIYLCGPRPFLRFFVAGLSAAGISADRIHYEFFGPADEALAA
ncbi:nitric oxide dioxygenase [Brucella pseudogrignonensis]|uniref:NO-inducible flavohemoprotein n=1 Tax=Brucella pseudogrignonensis TaxID=419475 RepID=UPI0007DA4E84|nr:NO-inducible flavohemoprotein [Brucella pseudogrignonensis]ANG98788.1 nitric oxide dioxygenase [Brucella pseudogrignonensis]